MSLNNITLSAGLVAEFCSEHLVDGQAVAVTAKPATPPPNATGYLGKNQQKICLLVAYSKEVYLPDDQLNFLTSILQACRLNLGDVAIVNLARREASFATLQQELGCLKLLLFGVPASSIGLPELPFFSVQEQAGCQVVCAPAAEELNNTGAESKVLKGKLWTCLKQLFNV